MTIRKLHKWLSILIGLQGVIWVSSGMIISLLDQQIVAGRTTKQTLPASPPLGIISTLVPLHTLDLDIGEGVTSVRLERALNRLIYRVDTKVGARTFDAQTGALFSISTEQASQIAKASYSGPGMLVNTEYFHQGSAEVHKAGAVWRADFDDQLATRVYISALDGSLVAHRNRYWKVVDFLLMLHFMDYARAHHFNNPQIIVIGFLALWLSISGLLLVKTSFTRRDFSWHRQPH